MKFYRGEEIIRYAKSILKRCKDRRDVVERTAKKFKIKPNTVQCYFSLMRFRTGFPVGISNYWGSIKRGERQPAPCHLPNRTLIMLSMVMKKPMFKKELEKAGITDIDYLFRTLRKNGISIKKFIFPVKRSGYKFRRMSAIYYMESQKIEVLKMLERIYGAKLNQNKRNILLALGIKFRITGRKYEIII